MNDDLKKTMKDIIARISTRLSELDELSGEPLPSVLGAPATTEQVAKFERTRGVELPEDYRTFLLLHDGWAGFSGESALLSLQEMTSGPLYEAIAELQKELRRVGERGPGEGLAIEGSYQTRFAYFDVANKKGSSAMDVVFWDRGEVHRYATFTEYLEDYVKTLDQMIASERELLR